jgi:hypothetical protein
VTLRPTSRESRPAAPFREGDLDDAALAIDAIELDDAADPPLQILGRAHRIEARARGRHVVREGADRLVWRARMDCRDDQVTLAHERVERGGVTHAEVAGTDDTGTYPKDKADADLLPESETSAV